ncbi:MAG: DHH family phosphoesterase [Oscillospiraceae bacterium]|nr:DHH family phosphoesterase [Oscillospiraceae bacterium]
MNNTLKRLAEPGSRLYMIFLVLFAAATLLCKVYGLDMYMLAIAEGGVILLLIVYTVIIRRRREKQLAAYIESVTYDTENAKNNTLMNFPLPIAVFQLGDSRIVWGNEMFFSMCGTSGTRLDARISDAVPGFTGKWLLEGKTQYPTLLELNGRQYQLHGNIIRSESGDENSAFMGITYWVDVTEYETVRREYLNSRPVAGVVVIDNLDELIKNQPERIKNDLRDAVEDKLSSWADKRKAILRRYDRDRYLVIFEDRWLNELKEEKFAIVEDVHQIVSPAGVNATISVGIGADGISLQETLQYAQGAAELALSRGGDQAVVKNRLSFDFYGGRGTEVEKRTKVKSRVMATTLAELVRDSSCVLVMGHRFADLDAIGAAVGVCCLARKFGVRANIVTDLEKNAAKNLIAALRQDADYRDVFMNKTEAMLRADGRTLLVVVDVNRPERVEDADLLTACNRVAVIDHHRVAATYIQNAALAFIEPYASSASELMTEVLQEVAELGDIRKCEAEALLSGIVLDTKSFTIRTGERTFDAAAFLRRAGADTIYVKKLLQNDMEDTVARYRIMQTAEVYRKVAIAVPEEPQSRIVAAQAADELLNISGIEASVVIAPDEKGSIFASARSIGEINVQILMEKLGGGGNRSAAAAQFEDTDLEEVAARVRTAIDEYLDQ